MSESGSVGNDVIVYEKKGNVLKKQTKKEGVGTLPISVGQNLPTPPQCKMIMHWFEKSHNYKAVTSRECHSKSLTT